MDESRRLAQFAADLRYEDIIEDALAKTKGLILDQLGGELWSAAQPWSRIVYEYIRDMGGRKDSTIVNFGDKVPAENAAFANSTFGHGFEIDDIHGEGASHPGSVIIPATLAMGEKYSISGRDFILATVLGYEVMGRLGKTLRPSTSYRGFHILSVVGPFGAAAAASKVMGFGVEKMLHALSIAGSHSGGFMEYNQTGGVIKRIHPAIASQAGLRSANLASKGITGPTAVLEGKNGLCRAFCDDPHLEKITDAFGKNFTVTEVGYKLHSCCGYIHQALDAVAQIVAENNISYRNLEEITVKTTSVAIHMVGAIREPRELTAAQFSLPFSIGLNLVKGGNSFKYYTEDNLSNADILAIARKVKMEAVATFDAEYPEKNIASVEIKLKNGNRYERRVDYPKGTPQNPATKQELEQKFRSLVSAVLPEDRLEAIIEAVDDLEHLNKISALSELLVVPG